MPGRLNRRSFITTIGSVALGGGALGLIAGARAAPNNGTSGITDRDPADPIGNGRGGVTDRDDTDQAGHGRGGPTDADSNDYAGHGRGPTLVRPGRPRPPRPRPSPYESVIPEQERRPYARRGK